MSAENQNIRILLVESWPQQNFNISFEIINSVVVLKIFTKFESLGWFQSWIIQFLISMTSSKWRKKKVFLKILKMSKSKNICEDRTFFSILIRFFWAITELFLIKCNESNILTCLNCVERNKRPTFYHLITQIWCVGELKWELATFYFMNMMYFQSFVNNDCFI